MNHGYGERCPLFSILRNVPDGRALARDLNVRPESIYYAARQGRKDAAHWKAILEK
jgi:hypothetical protein